MNQPSKTKRLNPYRPVAFALGLLFCAGSLAADDGEAQYAATLATLQAEIKRALPAVDARKKDAFLKSREAVKKATAAAAAAQQPLEQIKKARGLVDHAKGKWIGGAEKNIAKAEAALKKATSAAERQAAQADLAKAQADRKAGIKALQERQAALDQAKANEPALRRAHEAAQAALARAIADERNAAQALLADLDPFLSSDQLDAKLVKAAVIANATPRGLAEFDQPALIERLVADTALMAQMLEAGGARDGKYGAAMQIYTDIQNASPRAATGIFQRLALGTALQLAVPIKQRNAVTETAAPAFVDPVKRYLHYEQAYLAGELDPAFPDMTAWECRMIVNSYAPDHILAWGREMLRNYRPDHTYNPDYGWRYSGIVRTDITYRHSQEYTDTDSLNFFQNIIKNGGICGRRAFFGRYICKAFGLPTWGVAQHAHAALGRWTPTGWVVNFGAGWDKSWGPPEETEPGRRGADFLLETQARQHPDAYRKVLRAQWVGDVLGEPKYDSRKPDSGGFWNLMALFAKRVIVAEAKAVELAALGTELGEANESAEAKARAVAKTTVTDEDKQIVVSATGVITIPVVACTGKVEPMKSFLGGLQAFCGGDFKCEVDAPRGGKYRLTARVVTAHDERRIQLAPNIPIVIPYTVGQWGQTAPVEVTLVEGKNILSFTNPGKGFTMKDITLTPVN